MTKRLVLLQMAVALVCFSANAALAASNPDTGPGCGLGKLAWADYKHQKNILPQVMMATTNGTFGSNTFGISLGTSGCTEINFENLSQEMAQGQGEHLASLATLMGVPADQQPAFFALAQEKYTTLTQSGETAPVAMIKALNVAMNGHPALAQLTTNR